MSSPNTSLFRRMDAAIRQPWQIRTMAIVDAVIVNVIILIIGRLVVGEFPTATVGDDDQEIGFVSVIFVTVLVGLIAWGVLALLQRTTSSARTVWTAIAIAFLLVSLIGPLGSGVNTSSKVVLTLMHLGAAATIIPFMRRSIPARS